MPDKSELLAFGVIALCLLIQGIFCWFGKEAWMIAGYNTLPRRERTRIDQRLRPSDARRHRSPAKRTVPEMIRTDKSLPNPRQASFLASYLIFFRTAADQQPQ